MSRGVRHDSEEYLDHLDHSIKEIGRRGWQQEITDTFKAAGWGFIYHTYDSRHSPAGFPDTIIPGAARIIVIEAKVGNNKASVLQIEWLKEFAKSGALTFCLWPRHRPTLRALADGAWLDDPDIRGRLNIYDKRGWREERR